MQRRALGLPVLLIALIAACASTPGATLEPAPTIAAGTPAPATPTLAAPIPTPTTSLPSPIASPTLSLVPIVTPTATSSGTPPPSPEVTATNAPDSGIWRPLPGFPPPTSDIRDVAADPFDFVVAGSVARADGCPDAHIWMSLPDGDWFDAINGDTHNTTVVALTQPYGWPAFGHAGSGGCGAGEVIAYMPSDKADWYQPTVTGFLRGDEILDAIQRPSFDGVIASGAFADDGSHAGVWLGQIALRGVFRRASQPPATLGELTGLGVMGQTVFGFDNTADRPAWYSADSGDRWQRSPFRPDFWFVDRESVTFQGTGFVGGSACCTSPGTSAGMILDSKNGVDWQPATPLGLASPIEDMATMPTGLIAVSSSRDVYLSTDGTDWRRGPRLPVSSGDERLFVAATKTQVMVISNAGAWLAAVADLDATRWSEPAPAAQVPAIGDTYPRFSVNSACSPGPVRFDLRTWMPDPATLVNGDWPPRFDPNRERGELTFAASNRLVFAGEHGATVDFVPSPPAEGAPCA